ncbi:thiamine biosynthesis protein ApbE [Gordonibacter sp. An230]|uniref:FAD:protein FMN transferase n=1 Tax=Gordonibacter sp. An230 TaxID=1965592 RepID=UPI000B383CA4|nr:FAD:protein FMN transferase [Gordonibacter sp. An230]OUO88616.1 thiamine biosynthesis protein ApbE [Gordonibacter sp. An230]
MNDQTAYDDPIPLESSHETRGPDDAGMSTHLFYAFNTVVTLQAYGDPAQCSAAFDAARAACRTFERRLSRTLPHSDIARLNSAAGEAVTVHPDTAKLLREALRYCADSEGRFDITMGAAVRLWNFHEGTIPDRKDLNEALAHVNWRMVEVWNEEGHANASAKRPVGPCWFARIRDPEAAVDVGGIAKGWIADQLSALMSAYGLASFVVNLGGNVMAHGSKPDGSPWRIGLQDPRRKDGIVGAVAIRDASAVTSGVYERCFERDGRFYHHILDPHDGFPVRTDVAGATAVARRSIDAEGYSTTLVALGMERGIAFARSHPAILRAFFVDADGKVHEA